MVEDAQPKTGFGFVILSDTAPDVVTYPMYANFIWIKTSSGTPNGEIYVYTGAAWELVTTDVEPGTSTVTIAALSPTGGTAYQILRINAGATAFEFSTIIETIINGTLNLNKLRAVTLYDFMMVTSVGGVLTWTAGPINDLLPSDSIGQDKIIDGTTELEYSGTEVELVVGDTSAYYLELTKSVTNFNVINLRAGRTINCFVQQNGTGSWTITFDSDIKWPQSSAPAITATANHGDLLSFTNINGTIYGVIVKDYTP